MTHDPTEQMRRILLKSGQPEHASAHADERWDTAEMAALFTVHSFLAPFVMVTRKSDGKRGSLEFTHSPRFYFNFMPDED